MLRESVRSSEKINNRLFRRTIRAEINGRKRTEKRRCRAQKIYYINIEEYCAKTYRSPVLEAFFLSPGFFFVIVRIVRQIIDTYPHFIGSFV